MNTITMANALKAVFGAQTLTTASYFPACAQDGTPSGVISAANLASVLGVKRYAFGSVPVDTDMTIPDSYNGGLLICCNALNGKTHLFQLDYYSAFQATPIMDGAATIRRDTAGGNAIIKTTVAGSNYWFTYIPVR